MQAGFTKTTRLPSKATDSWPQAWCHVPPYKKHPVLHFNSVSCGVINVHEIFSHAERNNPAKTPTLRLPKHAGLEVDNVLVGR